MAEELVPIHRVKDGSAAAKWYARLGFVVEGEHRFAPNLPLYLFLRRGPNALHLSEHRGDARPNTLVYFYVDDVDPIAREFSVPLAHRSAPELIGDQCALSDSEIATSRELRLRQNTRESTQASVLGWPTQRP